MFNRKIWVSLICTTNILNGSPESAQVLLERFESLTPSYKIIEAARELNEEEQLQALIDLIHEEQRLYADDELVRLITHKNPYRNQAELIAAIQSRIPTSYQIKAMRLGLYRKAYPSVP